MQKGDYVYDAKTGMSFIFDEWVDERWCTHFCTLSLDGVLSIGYNGIECSDKTTINNPEIITEMDKALFKAGYYFDTEKMEMVGPRFKANEEDYFVPQLHFTNANDYEKGIMCKTKEEAIALEEVALEAIRKYLTKKK